MRAPPPEPTQHLRWPAEGFYWAVLDGSVLSSAGRTGRTRLSQRLGYLFESVLPGLAIEEIHAVYRPLPAAGSGLRYLACGVPRAVLEQKVPPQAVTLTPDSLPSFVDDEIDPADFNLLTGLFLPKAARSLQRRWLMLVALVLIACASLIVLGIERRVHAAQDQLASIGTAKARVLEQVIGPTAVGSGQSSQPPELRLTAELRRLEQTRSADVGVSEVVDGSVVLNNLLVLWPNDLHAQTESLSITPGSIDIRARVPTMADAQRMADAFVPLKGWRLQQPQTESRREHIDATLRLVRSGEPLP